MLPGERRALTPGQPSPSAQLGRGGHKRPFQSCQNFPERVGGSAVRKNERWSEACSAFPCNLMKKLRSVCSADQAAPPATCWMPAPRGEGGSGEKEGGSGEKEGGSGEKGDLRRVRVRRWKRLSWPGGAGAPGGAGELSLRTRGWLGTRQKPLVFCSACFLGRALQGGGSPRRAGGEPRSGGLAAGGAQPFPLPKPGEGGGGGGAALPAGGGSGAAGDAAEERLPSPTTAPALAHRCPCPRPPLPLPTPAPALAHPCPHPPQGRGKPQPSADRLLPLGAIKPLFPPWQFERY